MTLEQKEGESFSAGGYQYLWKFSTIMKSDPEAFAGCTRELSAHGDILFFLMSTFRTCCGAP